MQWLRNTFAPTRYFDKTFQEIGKTIANLHTEDCNSKSLVLIPLLNQGCFMSIVKKREFADVTHSGILPIVNTNYQ